MTDHRGQQHGGPQLQEEGQLLARRRAVLMAANQRTMASDRKAAVPQKGHRAAMASTSCECPAWILAMAESSACMPGRAVCASPFQPGTLLPQPRQTRRRARCSSSALGMAQPDHLVQDPRREGLAGQQGPPRGVARSAAEKGPGALRAFRTASAPRRRYRPV